MKNPSQALKSGSSLVLAEDEPYLQAFERTCGGKGIHEINRAVSPEPRSGPIDAPVVLLQLNPSYDDKPPCPIDLDKRIAALHDERSPHLPLQNGDLWWTRTFAAVLRDVRDPGTIATRVLSLEFFSYATKSFCHGHIRLPSQSYTFGLLTRAIERDALILVTRGFNLWCGAVPELATERQNVVKLLNPRRPFVSPGNLPGDAYQRVRRRIIGDEPAHGS